METTNDVEVGLSRRITRGIVRDGGSLTVAGILVEHEFVDTLTKVAPARIPVIKPVDETDRIAEFSLTRLAEPTQTPVEDTAKVAVAPARREIVEGSTVIDPESTFTCSVALCPCEETPRS